MPDGRTLILQSQRLPLPQPWLRDCLDSVRRWAASAGHDYRFIGDELFDPLDEELRHKTRKQPVVASDLARLRWLQRFRSQGAARVVWIDADVLIFDPERFCLPDGSCAVGREVWIDRDRKDRLKAWRKLHNAFLYFGPGDSLLDFYADSAERLLRAVDGPVSPQFIGPKLLTALHSLSRFPVLEEAAMFSPMLLRDLLGEESARGALELFLKHCDAAPAAANLCSSSVRSGALDNRQMARAIERLLLDPRLKRR